MGHITEREHVTKKHTQMGNNFIHVKNSAVLVIPTLFSTSSLVSVSYIRVSISLQYRIGLKKTSEEHLYYFQEVFKGHKVTKIDVTKAISWSFVLIFYDLVNWWLILYEFVQSHSYSICLRPIEG